MQFVIEVNNNQSVLEFKIEFGVCSDRWDEESPFVSQKSIKQEGRIRTRCYNDGVLGELVNKKRKTKLKKMDKFYGKTSVVREGVTVGHKWSRKIQGNQL